MTISTVTMRKERQKTETEPQIIPGLLMGGAAFVLLLVFLIGPFFGGIYYSFTNQRLISANPTEFVGLRNYGRLLKLAILPLEPLVDEATGEFLLDEAGNLTYPRSREFTRDEENYPQYADLTEWFSVDIRETRYFILAGDPTFMRSLVNNFFFALVVIPLQTGLGLLLALLVNQGLRGETFFRSMYFAPVVTSMVVVSIVWRFLYDFNNGLVNEMLGALTFGAIRPINWLGEPGIAMWAIIIMSIWQGAGFQMMLFVAGLQQIPEHLYEAASIDGANTWQRFRYVTLPGLRNVMVFIFLTITIAAFQLFDQVFVMTNGGPDDATTTTVFHMVRTGFREQNIAYASAIAVIFFLIIVGVNLVQRQAVRERSA
ncbi:MAG: sugar ABC transporter permease [Chloroflexi bacterium]|nr:sugar ABC transporter permease [Chloroflexota bacterium]MCI0575752.1 sugar ABC transporter permease [Chloroflexota bacterium]MCI0643641.1 sugar ABC transporter permease [Chloroflexota bacterium]MCI0729818.1 sugar ABC transporter permease [Chloroflexota bacterium]